ncbi:MAG: isoleucine--tRNA ligase [Spirochaetaceae bacterium]|nr:isoleucine--tRNA ligase [Spirochaetaceae bacterium]
MYKPVDPKVNFPKMEEKIVEFWKENDTFKKSISQREGCREYIIYDGPPFATGLPHFGHLVPSTLKDIFPRYQTMKGRKVERRFGWDCHGLPVEYEMEKELKISGKRAIEEFGVANFNEACRKIVLRYTKEWEIIITRLGRWVDFVNDYKTMNPDYMESIWWILKLLWEQGLMYEGYYILPFCPRCSTVLSNNELNLGGYKDVHDPSITVKFKLKGEENTYFLAWTTTPWTLPSNLALTVSNDITYVKVSDNNEFYILAKERLSAYYKTPEEYSIVWEKQGSELVGISYEPLFPYFAAEEKSGAFKVFAGDFVTTENGTGIVHTAPGFGEDDYNILKGTKITTVCPIDDECKFTSEVSDYKGKFVKDADKDIMDDLKKAGKLVVRSQYLHPYPHCWRCSSPIIYRAISSWFISVEKIKDKMLNANEQVSWYPSHLKHGRFGNWLKGARDWAISRNRYWGNPIPVWKCGSCAHTECLGSRKELEEKGGVKVDDLHMHKIDDITWQCSKCKKGTMKRIPEVLDCWFESGAMPYAQDHYPFENKERVEKYFPGDFICEGLDQTRGWFYTLIVLGAALFDKPAFQHVVVNGLVLAADGKKMSKSLKNYSDPTEVINMYGADALRFFLTNSAVLRAEDLRYSDDAVKEVLKNLILPIWNAYSFFVTYANIDNIKVDSLETPASPSNPLDKWILSEVEKLIEDITFAMDSYDIQKADIFISNFIDILNNWYIRRSRRRFWKSENDADKKEAYQTLYSVIMKLVTAACPIIPFITEEIYQNLKTNSMPESVHLCDYPVSDKSKRDKHLEEKMEVTRKVVSMGRALRSNFSIKTRQPLQSISVVTREQSEKVILIEMSEIIAEELNVKEVFIRENEDEFVEYKAKANFKALGKVLGKNMKKGAEIIETFNKDQVKSLLDGSVLSISIDNEGFELTAESIVVQRIEKEDLKVLNEGTITIGLDTKITEQLMQEGAVRDLVRNIQNLRKEKGLEVTDRIRLTLSGNEDLKKAVDNYSDYLLSETLTSNIEWKDIKSGQEYECGDYTCYIDLTKS